MKNSFPKVTENLLRLDEQTGLLLDRYYLFPNNVAMTIPTIKFIHIIIKVITLYHWNIYIYMYKVYHIKL